MSSERLHLVIRLGTDRYAIEAAHVVEIVSFVRLKAMPGAPAGVAGVMNYRDEAVPVVDLNLIAVGIPTPARLTTRIVITRYADAGLLGLLVPEATETVRANSDDFADAGVATDGAPYLGRVMTTEGGVIQQVTVSALLTAELRDALYRTAGAA